MPQVCVYFTTFFLTTETFVGHPVLAGWIGLRHKRQPGSGSILTRPHSVTVRILKHIGSFAKSFGSQPRHFTNHDALPARRLPTDAKLGDTSKTEVAVFYRAGNKPGAKIRPWPKHRGTTPEALSEWMDEYFEAIEHGYKPEGFTTTPIPFAARIVRNGRVLAEWKRSPSPSFRSESLVTDREREGPEGIPAAVPSAPCSEQLPSQRNPTRDPQGDSVETSRDRANVARLGQATLTTG